jgi:hypothetical protein
MSRNYGENTRTQAHTKSNFANILMCVFIIIEKLYKEILSEKTRKTKQKIAF